MSDDPVRAHWLEYAKDVVLSDDHTEACCRAGGGTLERGGEAWMRWPGYIGAAYEPGGLLFVGNIHRDFASNGVPQWVPDVLVAATRSLRADPSGYGDTYVNDIQRAYHRGLGGDPDGVRAWTVARPFQRVLADLGEAWTQVAYTNASKSQATPGQNADRLIEGCLKRWPLTDLVGILEPRAVVTCSAAARRALANASTPVHYFPQRFSYARLSEISEALTDGAATLDP